MGVDNHVSTLAEKRVHPRLAVLSVSTLLVYLDLQPIYRFLHVLTSRVRSVDGIGVFTVAVETHDHVAVRGTRARFRGVTTTGRVDSADPL